MAAAQEERFTRKKHDSSFPSNAIEFCLSSEGIGADDLELVVFYEKPFLKFDRIIETYARRSPRGFWSFRKAVRSWISEKIWIPSIIASKLGYKGEIIFSEHHESHAASAFFSSPFEEAGILVMDGVGEKTTITLAKGKGNRIELLEEQHFPHSLGLFYSAVTYYCGFRVNSGEYKLMGLAPYGQPIYKELMYRHFIKMDDRGVVELNMKYFDFETGLRMTNKALEKILGEPRRWPESEFSQFYKDIARSAQAVLEECVLKLAKIALREACSENLCLAGGVALNCKANQEILKSGICNNIWVQPASGDAGGSLGAAYIGEYHFHKRDRRIPIDSPVDHIYLGNAFSNDLIEIELKRFDLNFDRLDSDTLIKMVAERLNAKCIVGWFQGRMEFGPRALGSRSILASPKFDDMQEYLNRKIKMREGFRPFAPMVLEEKANEWFDVQNPSKYMLFTCNAKKAKDIPACVHVDNTARVQTVFKSDNEMLHELLKAFDLLSGIPVLINTSFNVRGEPIVNSVEDAVRCFFMTEMDFLAIGNFLVSKESNQRFDHRILKKVSYVLD